MLATETVVLTLGAAGAVAFQGHARFSAPGHQVQVMDRIGAGDAFAAGLLWGVLDGSIEDGLRRGLAMSALAMGVYGDLFRFNANDVQAVMSQPRREVAR